MRRHRRHNPSYLPNHEVFAFEDDLTNFWKVSPSSLEWRHSRHLKISFCQSQYSRHHPQNGRFYSVTFLAVSPNPEVQLRQGYQFLEALIEIYPDEAMFDQ